MNRELKFRMYLPMLQIMIDDKNINQVSDLIQYHTNPEKIQLMQFTGLQDKYGKDIYEGDIYEANGGLYQVFFHEGAFCGGKSIDWCSPLNWVAEVDPDSRQGEVMPAHFASKILVRGNIHENKELLKFLNPVS